jgi:hypothetical protein
MTLGPRRHSFRGMTKRSPKTRFLLGVLFLGLLVLAIAGWAVQGMRLTLALAK